MCLFDFPDWTNANVKNHLHISCQDKRLGICNYCLKNRLIEINGLQITNVHKSWCTKIFWLVKKMHHPWFASKIQCISHGSRQVQFTWCLNQIYLLWGQYFYGSRVMYWIGRNWPFFQQLNHKSHGPTAIVSIISLKLNLFFINLLQCASSNFCSIKCTMKVIVL